MTRQNPEIQPQNRQSAMIQPFEIVAIGIDTANFDTILTYGLPVDIFSVKSRVELSDFCGECAPNLIWLSSDDPEFAEIVEWLDCRSPVLITSSDNRASRSRAGKALFRLRSRGLAARHIPIVDPSELAVTMSVGQLLWRVTW